MSDLFLSVLNLSLTASWLILAVVILRLMLKKAPKWITCLLWALVAIRLICPVSINSALSLIPNSEPISHDITMDRNPAINSGITSINNLINPIIADNFSPNAVASVNPLQILIFVLFVIWIIGIAVISIYAVLSFVKLKNSVGASIALDKNVVACDEVISPFILGVVKPVIYVPSSLSGEALDYVIKHEITHIKRGDHLWKPLGYMLLTVYWFNPLCWVAYILLCRDIELACDERVVRDMDNAGKAAYSQALLNCSFPRRRIAACPVAFGEIGLKERVKAVLSYKKPAFWIVFVAIASCIAVGVCFMTDPKTDTAGENNAIVTCAGKYVCENPGIGGDFSITINEDGTFQSYEGALSSYIGTGKWTYNDNKIILRDEEMVSSIRQYIFDCENGVLVYNKTESADFTYVHLEDKTRFFLIPDSQEHIFSPSDGMSGSDKDETDHFIENNRQNTAIMFSDESYIFDDMVVEPRWYQFDGELLYFAYDLVNCEDTSVISVDVANEDIETVYYVANNYNPDCIVMWAIIHFEKYRDSVDLILGSNRCDKTYSKTLYTDSD